MSKNEVRSNALKSHVSHNPHNNTIGGNTSQFENLNKLHHYRELVRNREAKNTSLYNKRSIQDRLSPNLSIENLSHNDSTGLIWDPNTDKQIILKKGKLNREGIKVVKMDKQAKQKEMNFVLKEMIRQKQREREVQKEAEQQEFIMMMNELY